MEPESFLDYAYQREVFMELVSAKEDGHLVIMARGLGIKELESQLIDFYADPKFLAIVLGLSTEKSKWTLNRYQNRCPFPCFNIFSTYSSRKNGYKSGLYHLTPQIFLNDVLKNHLPVNLISTVLIFNAHALSEIEIFGIHLLKKNNPTISIKALCDQPEAIPNLERFLKPLFIREVSLWPRFHELVSENLDTRAIEMNVKEHRVRLSFRQKTIQICLVDLITSARKDLIKYSNNEEDLETEDILFDYVPIRDTIRNRQIAEELVLLRALALALTRVSSEEFDCSL